MPSFATNFFLRLRECVPSRHCIVAHSIWNCPGCLASAPKYCQRWIRVLKIPKVVQQPTPDHFDCLQIFRHDCFFAENKQTQMCMSMYGDWHEALWPHHEGIEPERMIYFRSDWIWMIAIMHFTSLLVIEYVSFNSSTFESKFRYWFPSNRSDSSWLPYRSRKCLNLSNKVDHSDHMKSYIISKLNKPGEFSLANERVFIESIACSMRSPFSHADPTEFVTTITTRLSKSYTWKEQWKRFISASMWIENHNYHMHAAAVLFDDCFTAGTMFCMLNDPLKSFRVTTIFPLSESNTRDGLVPIIGAFKAKFMATFACTQIFGIVHFFLCRIRAANGRWTPTHHFIMLKTNNCFLKAQFWI